MAKVKSGRGLMMVGSLRTDGLTTYMKQGQLIVRSSHSMQKRSNTMGQFVQRQRMRHSVALWKMLKYQKPMFTERPTAYNNFMSLANRLPVVYVEKGWMDNASFLMPGIPVSDGKLPTVKEELGEVDGMPALITDLKKDIWRHGVSLWLYTAVQENEGRAIHVRFSKREVSFQEVTLVDGHYVLKGEEFADPMKGWGLVLVIDDRCSPQTIVTRCTLYQQYMTEEALQTAAKSYGGLTNAPYLSPRY